MKRAAAAVVVGLTILPAACRSRSNIVLGVAVSPGFHAAVELAAREINAAGGIHGVPVELMGLDFANNLVPSEIPKWANLFASNRNLVAVIGHSDSASTLSAAAFYNQYGIPHIVTTATNPAITNIGEWTYRLCLSDAAQGPALADYAVKDWGKRKIAVFYVNDDYGRGLTQLFERRVRELGGTVVASVMHRNQLTAGDHETIHARLALMKETGPPDLVVLFHREAVAEWIIGAVRDTGMHPDFLGGDSLSTTRFLELAPEVTEGVRVSQLFFPLPENSRSANFVRTYRQTVGHDPDYGSALAYDAVFLLRDAVANGGSTRAGVKASLDRLIADKVQVEGVAGGYTLGRDHDARRALYFVEVRGGAYRLLKVVTVK